MISSKLILERKNHSIARYFFIISLLLLFIYLLGIAWGAIGYIGMITLNIKTIFWFIWMPIYDLFRIVIPISSVVLLAMIAIVFIKSKHSNLIKSSTKILMIAALFCCFISFGLIKMLDNKIRTEALIKAKNEVGFNTINNNWVGKTLPPFNLPDISGGQISNTDLIKKTSILIFWTSYSIQYRPSWEKPKNLEYANKLYLDKDSLDINVFFINGDISMEDVKQFLSTTTSYAPVYLDATGKYKRSLSISSYPEPIIIVDKQGIVREVLDADIPYEELIKKIKNVKE